MDKFITWVQQLDFDSVIQTALIVCASLLCITFHETCHGYAAYLLGDPTAKRAGRLTLNPLRHIDLVGLVMMAVVHFGWAKPVPVDMRNFKNPKAGMAITALAGPLANVLLAYIAVVLYMALAAVYYVKAAAWLSYVLTFLYCVQLISAGLAVFNIFPIPPLDGSKVLFALLPARAYEKLMRYERYGMALLAILLLTNVLDAPLTFLREGLLDLLTKGGSWAFTLTLKCLM